MNAHRLILLATVLLGASPDSLTADYKSFPGNMCVQHSSTGTPTYWYAAIGNAASSGTLRVDCPILNEGGAVDHQKARLVMIDQHPTEDIECTYLIVSVGIGAQLDIFSWTLNPTSGASLNHQLRGVPFGGFQFASDEMLYFSCSIPPAYNGAVSYIQMYEFEPLY